MNTIVEKIAAVPRAPSIGSILVDCGRISPAMAESVLRHQKEQGGHFGEVAVRLGFLGEEDLRHALAQQYDYPYLAADDASMEREVVAAFQPYAPIVENLRVLRSQLLLRWFNAGSGGRALAVVSPGQGDGRSFTAANLAVVFSQLGERTLLIDADLRKPRLHAVFRRGNQVGLSSILAGRASLAANLSQIQGLRGLSLLTSGPVPPNPQELLGRGNFGRLLDELRSQFDVILVDTSAATGCADSLTASASIGAALMVGRAGQTRTRDMQVFAGALRESHVAVLGAVLNRG